MARRGIAVLLLGAAVIALLGCGSGGRSPAPAIIQVTCEEFEAAGSAVVERSLDIPAGAEFVVILCSNPSTGFTWEDPTSDGDAGIEIVDRSSAQPLDAPPGTPGREMFDVRATGAGSAVMHFVYSQPWAGGTKGAWRLDLAVAVR